MRPQRLLVVLLLVVPVVVAFASPAASRNPALFSDEAGFHQARFAREPIGVEARPWLDDGMRYWNNRAGWDVFVFSDAPQVAAEFDASCVYCARAYPSWTQPYTHCEISIAGHARDEVSTVAHELGHCLGLRHQPKGVMSSDTPKRIPAEWKTFDHRLLVEAGYAAD